MLHIKQQRKRRCSVITRAGSGDLGFLADQGSQGELVMADAENSALVQGVEGETQALGEVQGESGADLPQVDGPPLESLNSGEDALPSSFAELALTVDQEDSDLTETSLLLSLEAFEKLPAGPRILSELGDIVQPLVDELDLEDPLKIGEILFESTDPKHEAIREAFLNKREQFLRELAESAEELDAQGQLEGFERLGAYLSEGIYALNEGALEILHAGLQNCQNVEAGPASEDQLQDAIDTILGKNSQFQTAVGKFSSQEAKQLLDASGTKYFSTVVAKLATKGLGDSQPPSARISSNRGTSFGYNRQSFGVAIPENAEYTEPPPPANPIKRDSVLGGHRVSLDGALPETQQLPPARRSQYVSGQALRSIQDDVDVAETAFSDPSSVSHEGSGRSLWAPSEDSHSSTNSNVEEASNALFTSSPLNPVPESVVSGLKGSDIEIKSAFLPQTSDSHTVVELVELTNKSVPNFKPVFQKYVHKQLASGEWQTNVSTTLLASELALFKNLASPIEINQTLIVGMITLPGGQAGSTGSGASGSGSSNARRTASAPSPPVSQNTGSEGGFSAGSGLDPGQGSGSAASFSSETPAYTTPSEEQERLYQSAQIHNALREIREDRNDTLIETLLYFAARTRYFNSNDNQFSGPILAQSFQFLHKAPNIEYVTGETVQNAMMTLFHRCPSLFKEEFYENFRFDLPGRTVWYMLGGKESTNEDLLVRVFKDMPNVVNLLDFGTHSVLDLISRHSNDIPDIQRRVEDTLAKDLKRAEAIKKATYFPPTPDQTFNTLFEDTLRRAPGIIGERVFAFRDRAAAGSASRLNPFYVRDTLFGDDGEFTDMLFRFASCGDAEAVKLRIGEKIKAAKLNDYEKATLAQAIVAKTEHILRKAEVDIEPSFEQTSATSAATLARHYKRSRLLVNCCKAMVEPISQKCPRYPVYFQQLNASLGTLQRVFETQQQKSEQYETFAKSTITSTTEVVKKFKVSQNSSGEMSVLFSTAEGHSLQIDQKTRMAVQYCEQLLHQCREVVVREELASSTLNFEQTRTQHYKLLGTSLVAEAGDRLATPKYVEDYVETKKDNRLLGLLATGGICTASVGAIFLHRKWTSHQNQIGDDIQNAGRGFMLQALAADARGNQGRLLVKAKKALGVHTLPTPDDLFPDMDQKTLAELMQKFNVKTSFDMFRLDTQKFTAGLHAAAHEQINKWDSHEILGPFSNALVVGYMSIEGQQSLKDRLKVAKDRQKADDARFQTLLATAAVEVAVAASGAALSRQVAENAVMRNNPIKSGGDLGKQLRGGIGGLVYGIGIVQKVLTQDWGGLAAQFIPVAGFFGQQFLKNQTQKEAGTGL